MKRQQSLEDLQNLPVGHFSLVSVLHLALVFAYRTTLPSFCKTRLSGGGSKVAHSLYTVFDSQDIFPSVFLTARFPFDWNWKTSTSELFVLLDQSNLFLHNNSKLPLSFKMNL